MKNLDQLRLEICLILCLPLPIKGLAASPVNIVVLEGVPGFC